MPERREEQVGGLDERLADLGPGPERAVEERPEADQRARRGPAASRASRPRTPPPPRGGCRAPRASRSEAVHACPAISAPIRPRSTASRANAPTKRPLREHQHPVGQREDLVQLERDQQHADARVARLDQARLHQRRGADVDPAGRLVGHHQLAARRPARGRPRASAGCRPRASPAIASASGGRTSKRSITSRAAAPYSREGEAALAAQHDVVAHAPVQHQRLVAAVLRDDPDAAPQPRRAALAGRSGSPAKRSSPANGMHPGQRVGQRRLAVALDPGDADDLARADLEARRRSARRCRCPRRSRAPSAAARARSRRARPAPAPRRRPSRARSRRRRLARDVARDDPAGAHHGDPVGVGDHLGQLVGDDQHRGAARRPARARS